jgi:hypothetical protein
MTKYKIGDTINLKTLEKLLLEITNEYEERTERGFHLKSGLFINKDMFKLLGKKYKIKNITQDSCCYNKKGYMLEIEDFWTWDELCFEEGKQLEFEF